VYEASDDPDLLHSQIDQSSRDQDALWSIASSTLRVHEANLGISLLMQSLNETIDVSAEQLRAMTTHVPTTILVLALVLVILAALSIGFRFARDASRPAILSSMFVAALVLVISMVVDK
jgi:uncharacterized membrane protein YhaH (DUF805 family)